jgi:hypothetical protein
MEAWVDFEATKIQLIAYLPFYKSKNCIRHITKVVTGVQENCRNDWHLFLLMLLQLSKV